MLGFYRSHMFSPRPFAVSDPVTFAEGERADANLTNLVAGSGVTHLVIDDPHPPRSAFTRLVQRCGRPLAGPTTFRQATRNPFNWMDYKVQVFQLADCGAR